MVRGEGFSSSDLDVVVLFDHVANAWRESFHFRGWPVEVFAHDPGTLAYFVAPRLCWGAPSLAQMISEALVIPDETPTSRASTSVGARQRGGEAAAGPCVGIVGRRPLLAHGSLGRLPR